MDNILRQTLLIFPVDQKNLANEFGIKALHHDHQNGKPERNTLLRRKTTWHSRPIRQAFRAQCHVFHFVCNSNVKARREKTEENVSTPAAGPNPTVLTSTPMNTPGYPSSASYEGGAGRKSSFAGHSMAYHQRQRSFCTISPCEQGDVKFVNKKKRGPYTAATTMGLGNSVSRQRLLETCPACSIRQRFKSAGPMNLCRHQVTRFCV